MIIIKVQGGLGNQLLQYSIGRVIALRFNKVVAYDLSFFDGETKYTKRPYLLDTMNTLVRVATNEEIVKAKYPYGFFSKVTEKIARVGNKYIFKKYYVGYDKDFFTRVERNEHLYVEGFWQSFRYYEKNLKELSQEISLKDSTHLDSCSAGAGLSGQTSVAVHIRRGDFLNKGSGIQVLPKEYYKKAVEHIKTKVSSPTYYIFSDDIQWVKEQMGELFTNTVYPSTLGLTDVEEFMLMKSCNHAIIANSTFSWFSTLLTNSLDKIVVYSNDWKNPFLNGDKNICPLEWVGL